MGEGVTEGEQLLFVAHVVRCLEIASHMAALYEEIRGHCQDIAGCDLTDWDLETVQRYADLAMEHYIVTTLRGHEKVKRSTLTHHI